MSRPKVRAHLASAALASLSFGCTVDSAGVSDPNGGGGGTPSGGVSGNVNSSGTATTVGAAGTAPQAGGVGGDATAGSGGTGVGGGDGVGGAAGGVFGSSAGSAGMPNATGGAPGGPPSGRQTAKPAGTVQGTTVGYWEYLPPHYGNGAKYPLIIFRHGLGENGNGSLQDLQKVTKHGPPKLIAANQWPETRTFIVLSAQESSTTCPTVKEMDDFMTFALGKYDVDLKRVYLTGLSCGAIATWNYLGDHTDERVAAAIPIAGDGRPAFKKIGCQLGKVPIWAFHGQADDQVAPAGSIETIANLKACTNPAALDARLTTYPGVKHDSWTMTYDLSNPANDIYAWLMSHPKP